MLSQETDTPLEGATLTRHARLPLTLIAIVLGWCAAAPAEASDPDPEQGRKGSSRIHFMGNLEQGLAEGERLQRPVFLAFGATWCAVCRTMESSTLLDPRVQALAPDFVWVRIDIDRSMTLAREWNVEATPTIYLLAPDGRRLRTIVGGPTAGELADLLRGALATVSTGAPAREAATTYASSDLVWTPSGFRSRAICFSHVGYGPLAMRSQSPFQSLRMTIAPRTPSTLSRGEWQARVVGTRANIWANDEGHFFPQQGEYGRYFLDYEMTRLGVELGYGVGDAVELDLEYNQRWRGGGFLDGLIQNFHRIFGFSQNGRDEVSRNQFHFFLNPGDGRPVVDLGPGDEGTFDRNLQLSLQHNVTCGSQRWPAFSYSVTARWTLDSPDLEGSDLDVAASVALARRFGHFYTYLTAGYTWFGSDSFHGIQLDHTQASLLAAVEWRFKSRMSLVLQYLWTEAAVSDFGPFSKPSNEVVIGWKGEIRPAGVLEVGLLENVITFDNSPDFGIHLGYTQRF